MFALDKKKHFIVGFFIVCVFSFVIPVSSAIGLAVVVGAGKELYDFISGKGIPELADFIFTCAGAGLAGLIISAISRLT